MTPLTRFGSSWLQSLSTSHFAFAMASHCFALVKCGWHCRNCSKRGSIQTTAKQRRSCSARSLSNLGWKRSPLTYDEEWKTMAPLVAAQIPQLSPLQFARLAL